MKMIKFILLCGALAFLAISCSESPVTKSHPVTPPNSGWGPANPPIIAQDTLYTIIPDSSLTKQQRSQLDSVIKKHNNEYTLSVHLARLNSRAGVLLERADTLAFPVSTDSLYVAVKKSVTRSQGPNNGKTYIIWEASISYTGGKIQLVYSRPKGIRHDNLGNIIPTYSPVIGGFKLIGLGHGLEAVIRGKKANVKIIQ